MKKFVLRLDLLDDKEKRKALKTVAVLPGIDLIAMDMKEKKLTVVGTVDPVKIVSRLRKFWPTDIILVGPAKEPEPEKKEETKKEGEKKEEEGKKEEGKKDEEKKEGEEGKKDETKKDDEKKKEPEPIIGIIPHRPYYGPMHNYAPPMPYRPYYAPTHSYQYAAHHHSMDENPNACVIS